MNGSSAAADPQGEGPGRTSGGAKPSQASHARQQPRRCPGRCQPGAPPAAGAATAAPAQAGVWTEARRVRGGWMPTARQPGVSAPFEGHLLSTPPLFQMLRRLEHLAQGTRGARSSIVLRLPAGPGVGRCSLDRVVVRGSGEGCLCSG